MILKIAQWIDLLSQGGDDDDVAIVILEGECKK
jgi:hypothetical protein